MKVVVNLSRATVRGHGHAHIWTLCLLLAVAIGSQAAPPAGAADLPRAPTTFTGGADPLTTSTATLKGSVNPGGQTTSYYFQYGQSIAYEAQTPPQSIPAGTQTVHVSVPVSGLASGSVYHFRLIADNASGTADGLDQRFTTLKIPLAFTLAASPSIDVFGNPFLVAGTLSGTASADHLVELQANPFPYLGGFKALGGQQLTSASGSFSFSVPALPETTQLRVVTLGSPAVNSRVLVERVAVRVTLQVRASARHGFARLYGAVSPSEPGAQVRYQLLRPGRRALNVGSSFLTGSSSADRFSHVLRIRHAGLYRVLVQVASGAQASGHSRTILIR
jgi:hypothetical protein